MHGAHDSRIRELERIVLSLQSQLDALEGRSTNRSESELPSALFNAEAGFSHGVTYDNGWTLRPKNPQSTSIFDHGFFVQAGTFVKPETVEFYARGSAVLGPYGNGSECAGGNNWYVRKKPNWRVTMDVSQVEDAPAQQDRTGYVAGGSGLLVRAQVWTCF